MYSATSVIQICSFTTQFESSHLFFCFCQCGVYVLTTFNIHVWTACATGSAGGSGASCPESSQWSEEERLKDIGTAQTGKQKCCFTAAEGHQSLKHRSQSVCEPTHTDWVKAADLFSVCGSVLTLSSCYKRFVLFCFLCFKLFCLCFRKWEESALF